MKTEKTMDNGQWTMDINTIKETERRMDKANGQSQRQGIFVLCPLSIVQHQNIKQTQNTMARSQIQERYTYIQLAVALTNAVQAKKGADTEAYTYDDICTLVRCWAEHPKFPSPRENTMVQREIRTDGAGYLQLSEITSFQIYAGYNLMRYL